MSSLPYSITIDDFMKPDAPKPPPLPTPFEMLTLPTSNADSIEQFLTPEFHEPASFRESPKKKETKKEKKPRCEKCPRPTAVKAPAKKRPKKRRARTFHTICRKCNQDYYYTKTHLNEGRCGTDICHTCGMIRALTPLQNLFF